MNKARLDPNQIIQKEHDADSGAKKVKIIDTSIEILLNQEKDKVTVFPSIISREIKVNQEVILNPGKYLRFYVFGKTEKTIELNLCISPLEEGPKFVALSSDSSFTINKSENIEFVSCIYSCLLAKRLKLISDSECDDLQIFLMEQSV